MVEIDNCTAGYGFDVEARRLKALSDLELLDTAPEAPFDQIAHLAKQFFEVPIALISLIDSRRQWFKAKHGLSVSETPRDVAFCDHAIRGDAVYVVCDASKDPAFRTNPLVTGDPNIRFYAGAPLKTGNGQNIGTLCVIDSIARNFSNRDRDLLAGLARLVILEAENRLLRRKMMRQASELQLEKRSAEAADEAKSHFLSHISHEMRTPTHAILNFAQIGLAKHAKGPDRNADVYFSRIHASGTRLLALLNDLLDLEKLESGKVHYEFATHDFADVIYAANEEIEPLLSDKKVRLCTSVESGDPSAIFDRRRILQVLINIIANAIKYSPPRGEIDIIVSDTNVLPYGPALLCSISDQGPGIPEGELESIFEKYVQSSRTRRDHEGTGLGLSICREIVTAHGGKIWAANGCLAGASIQFVIPKTRFGVSSVPTTVVDRTAGGAFVAQISLPSVNS